jgi:hypothetical protein
MNVWFGVFAGRSGSRWLIPTLPGVSAYFRLRHDVAAHHDIAGGSPQADIRHANGSGARAV